MTSKKLRKKRKVHKETNGLRKATVQGMSDSPLSARSERLRAEAEERRRKKLVRRQVMADFQLLLDKGGDCEICDIASFISKFDEEIELVRETLQPYKYSESYPAVMIWRYILGETDEKLDRLITESRLLAKRATWLEMKLPDPIVIPVKVTEHGPEFNALSLERVQRIVEGLLGEATPDFQVNGPFPFSRPGDHTIQLEFSEGLKLSRVLRLELCQDELPSDCIDGLADSLPLPLFNKDVLQTLKQHLAEVTPSDILAYYPRMSSVLVTAYNSGYWNSPWVQNTLREWRARREEYLLHQKLQEISGLVEQLNQSGPWLIPEEYYDRDSFSEQEVLEITQRIISENVKLSQYPIEFCFSGDVDQAVLPVEVLWQRLPVGTLKLLRPSVFMPADVRREILQARVSHLQEMINCSSEQTLLEIANRENRSALRIVDKQSSPDHPERARYLAGICRVLLERGMVEGIQFKRTLTCYYVARGGEFYINDPLKARRYYLLFFRMLYQEQMLEHLKAIAPLDYWVLAAFFATYTDKTTRAMKAPGDIRSLEKSQPMAPMLWRATQLLYEDPRKFFDALFDLYVVEADFVRDLLVNLRRVRRHGTFNLKRKGKFTLDYLNPDSAKLIADIIAYSVESNLSSITNDLLLEFILSVLDIRDIAQPVFNDFKQMLDSVREFMNAKDVVQKSALYTDVDRGFLQARGVAGRLAQKQRLGTEESRKKAGRLNRLVEEFKAHVDRMHREFFRSARLEVEINTFTLPRYELSPVEVQITNTDFGPASSVTLQIEQDPSFYAREYDLSLNPIYGKDNRIEALYISPLGEKAVELRGTVRYSDQEESDKTVLFQHTINISDPSAFSPFKSPYITGAPVRDSEMFFGRREELDEVIRLLRGHFQDRITVIHGRRKVGKTSILYQLKQGDPNLLSVSTLQEVQESYIPVLIDFERFTDEKAAWEVYYKIYLDIRHELDLVDIPIKPIPITDFRDLPADALLENFVIQVEQLLFSTERRLLLMFDEFDNLIRYKGEESGLFGFIRELIIKHGQHISFIFVGADQLVEMMKTRTNRLYSMAGTPVEIADLAPEEARLLVTEPMRKVNPEFEWAEGAIQLIVHLTARNPYHIQALCDRVVNNLIAGKRLRATTIDVEQGVREIVNHIGDLADIIGSLNSVEEKALLACIANLAQHERIDRVWATGSEIERRISTISRKFPRKVIPRILRSLQARYILDQREEETEMKYCIRVPLLEIYVQNTLKLKDVLREGGYV